MDDEGLLTDHPQTVRCLASQFPLRLRIAVPPLRNWMSDSRPPKMPPVTARTAVPSPLDAGTDTGQRPLQTTQLAVDHSLTMLLY
jgi:hypothetical protein